MKAATELRKTAALGWFLAAIAAGAALFAFGSDDRKLVGILLVSVSAIFSGRIRRDKVQTGLSIYGPPVTQLDVLRSSWPLAAACAVLIVGSYYVLHLDAVHGHDEVAPVLFFAFSGLCSMAYLIYIFGRLSNRG